jgi:hypothetical protein
MRNLLYAATALGGLALALPANATLISTATSTGGALTAGCNTTTNTGSLVASCSGGGFSTIAITAAGPPQLTAPDLSATTLTVTTTPLGAATTLHVHIDSNGWSFAGGPVEALLTVNNLIGSGIGPFVLTAQSPVGNESHTFTGSGATTVGPVTLPAFTSDAADFLLTFGASATPQSIDATIEIVGVAAPEPSTLAILGLGVLGLAYVSSRKRRYVSPDHVSA